jgi:hypothetical protein
MKTVVAAADVVAVDAAVLTKMVARISSLRTPHLLL